jgi:UDP-glucose 4-epimerase
LYADSTKIQRELGWRARYTEIDAVAATAWNWFRRRYAESDKLA